MRPAAPAYAYAAVSLSNVVATLCQYEALKYLTFPLQVRMPAPSLSDTRHTARPHVTGTSSACLLLSHGHEASLP